MENQEAVFEIRPPKLEDAGLEDCALSPEAIKEAFLKAASYIKSRSGAIFSVDDEVAGTCVHNPGPSNGAPPDSLVRIYPGPETDEGSCGAEKGGLPEVYGDKVIDGVGGARNRDATDRILDGEVPESDADRGCTDGLQGLEIEKAEERGGFESDKDDEGEDEDRPVLAEAWILGDYPGISTTPTTYAPFITFCEKS